MDDAPPYDDKNLNDKAASISHERTSEEGDVYDNADQLQRHLGNRQIQLIAIGGSIGTALFVSINAGLYAGGPGSLFIGMSQLKLYTLAMVLIFV